MENTNPHGIIETIIRDTNLALLADRCSHLCRTIREGVVRKNSLITVDILIVAGCFGGQAFPNISIDQVEYKVRIPSMMFTL